MLVGIKYDRRLMTSATAAPHSGMSRSQKIFLGLFLGIIAGMLAGFEAILKLTSADTRIVPGHGAVVDKSAVAAHRDIMGATNPANADAGTIRKELAESIEANSVHGSDSEENAAIEIAYFFAGSEIVG